MPSSMKPRSHAVTDGLERAAARGMLRAVGMGDEDWEKPQRSEERRVGKECGSLC